MDKAAIDKITRALVDKGLLLEAGWAGYNLSVLPEDAPKVQRDECRLAFFAGAQHLFSSIMSIMDADREPTADDLRRMSLINAELDTFIAQFKVKHGLVTPS